MYNSLNFRISLLSIIFIDLLFPEIIPRKQTHRNNLIKVFLMYIRSILVNINILSSHLLLNLTTQKIKINLLIKFVFQDLIKIYVVNTEFVTNRLCAMVHAVIPLGRQNSSLSSDTQRIKGQLRPHKTLSGYKKNSKQTI